MLIAKHQSDPGQKTYMLNYWYLLYSTVAVDLHYEEGRHYEVNVTFML